MVYVGNVVKPYCEISQLVMSIAEAMVSRFIQELILELELIVKKHHPHTKKLILKVENQLTTCKCENKHAIISHVN